MKKLFFTLAVSITLFTSCSTDEPIEETPLQQTADLYVFEPMDPSGSWRPLTNVQPQLEHQTMASNDWPGERHTQGRYIAPQRDTFAINWIGSDNEYGAQGQAELLITYPSYQLQLVMETECVSVYENGAMYGGIVTEIIVQSGNPPPMELNWRFYFKVVDGGGTSGEDQISNTQIFASPRSISLCDVYPADHPIWDSNGYQNIHQPNFVIVEDSTN